MLEDRWKTCARLARALTTVSSSKSKPAAPSHGVKAAPLALLTLRWVSRHLPELGHVDIYCPWDDTAPVRSPQRELS